MLAMIVILSFHKDKLNNWGFNKDCLQGPIHHCPFDQFKSIIMSGNIFVFVANNYKERIGLSIYFRQ